MAKSRTISGDLVWPRHEAISWQVSVRSDMQEWDKEDLDDWVDKAGAALYTQIKPLVHPLGASKELQRDANGQMLRIVEMAADPPADTMASQGMAVVMRAVIDSIFGDAK